MRRTLMLAGRAANGDLIIASNNTRMRVESVAPVNGGSTVIIIGRTAAGTIGIAHPVDLPIVKLE